MEENFSMEWKIFGMEWKKLASMKYGKSSSIPFHALTAVLTTNIFLSRFKYKKE